MKFQKQLTTVTPLSKAVALFLFIALPIVAFFFGMYYQQMANEAKVSQDVQRACTLEAKICPDGSSVGRSGPNCEFTPCPTVAE